MNAFQIIGLSVAALFLALNFRSFVRQADTRATSLAWIAIGCLGAYAIFDPDSTTRFAGLVGVQRGADLLLYVGTLCGIAAFCYLCIRLRRIDRSITTVVRRIAIEHAATPDLLERGLPSLAEDYDVEEPIP